MKNIQLSKSKSKNWRITDGGLDTMLTNQRWFDQQLWAIEIKKEVKTEDRRDSRKDAGTVGCQPPVGEIGSREDKWERRAP